MCKGFPWKKMVIFLSFLTKLSFFRAIYNLVSGLNQSLILGGAESKSQKNLPSS